MRFNTYNAINTFDAGIDFGERLRGGDVVLLYGDLGVGKTVFTSGIAYSLGITESILSPTFTVMNEYEGRLKLYHYDAYRLKNGEEAVFAGIAEFIGSPDSVCVIEWPDNIADILPSEVIKVSIERIDDNERAFEITDNRNK